MTSDTRLFVGRLAPTVQKRDLEELFGRYGTIANCSLKTSYGFVEYEDARDARDAVRELDGHRLEGSKIAVEYSHGRRSDRENRNGGRDSRGDHRDRDYRSGRGHRDRYHDRDREHDRDRDRDDRDRDHRGGGGGKYGRGRYSPPYNTEFRISVTGLPQGCSWQDLKDHFRQIGEVCFADVRRDRDSKETGIVEFKREEDMKESVRSLDRSKLRGSTISVYCEYDSKRSRSRSSSRSRRRRSPKRSRSPRSRKRVSRSVSPPPRKSHSPSPRKSRSPSPRKSHSPSPRKSRSLSPKPSVSPHASPRSPHQSPVKSPSRSPNAPLSPKQQSESRYQSKSPSPTTSTTTGLPSPPTQKGDDHDSPDD